MKTVSVTRAFDTKNYKQYNRKTEITIKFILSSLQNKKKGFQHPSVAFYVEADKRQRVSISVRKDISVRRDV